MHGQLAREFAEMALRLHDSVDPEQAAAQVLRLALCGTKCGHVGVMLCPGGARLEAAVATDYLAEIADKLQVELSEGPCVATSPASCRIDDTATDRRWTHWNASLAEMGLRSVLSIPLSTESSTVGRLNLYDEVPYRFSHQDMAIAGVVALHAVGALTRSAGRPDRSALVHQPTAGCESPVRRLSRHARRASTAR
ncbi:GAF domain-containing protein [Kribbella catacumbae]|uniref:GAF domain-containing protein n=1 Tax=Kribbella catacumbae TaxID=460086 RepID=UPI000360614E|nr:GAF domain-containing protein [Kribbella catacumbae]